MSMEIRLVRIDDRLIHGQVVTVWAKITKVNRILVISDAVAKDMLRKTLLKQAAPPGVNVNVITIDKMISIYDDPIFNTFKTMLLFTNPRDVRRVVEGGVSFDSINIGGMSFSDGKKMITNAVAVNHQDIEDLLYLSEQGIDLEIRKVVTDSKVYMMDLLKKEGMV
ncbi:mannose/fructose/sorbose PTS transporter subunit IIB [Carnobacterium viridans]|uniref:PTS system, mannose-specific IIB component n=1 Tax=Carnobacterium viridans TaxID=174587 RepID=A0A1H1ARA4_9LACT|nr:mannose/fructose/sorbose PTS transporter subunit IIB [Carnobacterium viridans]UDE96083.1 mannose/fructose/sorbose PTS transporter subunit IIB [Carnobacterium viridans]SDQ42189.1 PTS system, mannose-specific IIB component [Carnobacterium viridans]